MPVFQLLTNSAARFPDHVAIRFENRTYTYQELKEHVDRLSTVLAHLGIQKGDRVALIFQNSPEYIISYYGVLQAGGIVVQVNPFYKERELLNILQDSEAGWVLCEKEQWDKLKTIQSHTNIQQILLFGLEPEATVENAVHVEQLLASTQANPPDIPFHVKEDVAVLQYTGGTTGRSKGAMLTHYNLVANVQQCYQMAASILQIPGEIMLCLIPLYHVYSMTSCMNYAIFLGATIVLRRKFDVNEVFELIQKYRPTLFPAVPTMFIALLNHPKSNEVDLSSLKHCISGSAPIPTEIIRRFEEKTGAIITEGYGLSEASPVTHRNPLQGKRKPGSIGIPLPYTEAKIVDLETGTKTLPPGKEGELVVRGPQVMKGYWKNPEETKQALRDGWLYTGDIAKRDEENYYYIVGRKKEMIITGGFNVYPNEVEEVLYKHPGVREAAVIGITDDYRGEAVKAFIVPQPHVSLTEDELIQFCRSQLANYKVPRCIEFRDSLPKSNVGKVLRRILVEEERRKRGDKNEHR